MYCNIHVLYTYVYIQYPRVQTIVTSEYDVDARRPAGRHGGERNAAAGTTRARGFGGGAFGSADI